MSHTFKIMFVFFLSLLLFSCFNKDSSNNYTDPESQSNTINEDNISSENLDKPLLEPETVATETNDVSKAECMNGCIMMWKSNESNANRSEADMMKDCNSLCEANQGMQTNDADACAKAEGIMKDTCYSDVAKNTKDPTLCEKITDKMFISACYLSIVEQTKDKSLCEKITEPMLKNLCLEE